MAQSCFSHFIWAWSPLCNIQEIPGACEQLTWICSTGSYWQYTFYAFKEHSHTVCTHSFARWLAHSLLFLRSLSLSPSLFLRGEHYWHDCLNIKQRQSSQIRWVNSSSNKHSRLYTYGRVWSGHCWVMSCAIHVWEMKRKCIELRKIGVNPVSGVQSVNASKQTPKKGVRVCKSARVHVCWGQDLLI